MSNITPNRIKIPGFVLNTTSTTAPSLTDPSLNTAFKNQMVQVGTDYYFVDALGVATKIETPAAAELETTSLTPKHYNGTAYVGSQANAEATSADVMELSDGSLIHDGKVTWTGHGLTVGSWYYTSQSTAGAYVTPEPTTGWSQQLFFVLDENTILVDIEPAEYLDVPVGEDIVSPYMVTAYSTANYALPTNYIIDVNRYNTIDTANSVGGAGAAFNTSTYRFTPTRAGWYDVKANYRISRGSTVDSYIRLRKNGNILRSAGGHGVVVAEVGHLVYLNGTTDYVDVINQGGGSVTTGQFLDNSTFQARWLHY